MIGATPAGESCECLGANYDSNKAQKECHAFIRQLTRQFGVPPQGARFAIKNFPHDFGSYKEVCVVYDDNNEEAIDFAFKVERESPENWDDKAQIELMPRF